MIDFFHATPISIQRWRSLSIELSTRSGARLLGILLVFVALTPPRAFPQQTTAPTPAASLQDIAAATPMPTLVILVVVDQMRADYFDRMEARFSGGLSKLYNQGAVFTDAHHNHAITATAPGHASMLSGLYPRDHGIVDNNWYDFQLQRTEQAGVDPNARVVGLDPTSDVRGPAGSPYQFNGTTLIDWLRERDPRSRSVSVSRKDRSAVLMAPSAHHVYWFHWSGRFVTSDHYTDQLPVWVQAFNDTDWMGVYAGEDWRLLAAEAFYEGSRPDDYRFEAEMRDFGRDFPHRLPTDRRALGEQIISTPFMDAAVLDLAQAAIINEGLGQVEGTTDVLAVGLSSTDAVGHAFGPFSREIQDQLMRLDLRLGSFLAFVEETVGLDRTILVLTSDHGVAALPEHSRDQGLEAERIEVGALIGKLDRYLSERFGGQGWVSAYSYLWFNISRRRAAQVGVEHGFVVAAAKEFLDSLDEVAEVFTRYELIAPLESRTELIHRVRNSFHPSRSGDLYLIHHPYSIWHSGSAANHQSPYHYDTHVPLIFFGPQFQTGRYDGRVSIVDLAPTLAAATGATTPPNLEGRALSEAFGR